MNTNIYLSESHTIRVGRFVKVANKVHVVVELRVATALVLEPTQGTVREVSREALVATGHTCAKLFLANGTYIVSAKGTIIRLTGDESFIMEAKYMNGLDERIHEAVAELRKAYRDASELVSTLSFTCD